MQANISNFLIPLGVPDGNINMPILSFNFMGGNNQMVNPVVINNFINYNSQFDMNISNNQNFV